MEQQHTPHRQKNGCKGPLLALLLGLAELGAFWYFRRSIAAMNWFIQYVSMPYKRVLSALVDPLPFSAGELVCTLGGLWLVWMAVRTLRQQRPQDVQPRLQRRRVLPGHGGRQRKGPGQRSRCQDTFQNPQRHPVPWPVQRLDVPAGRNPRRQLLPDALLGSSNVRDEMTAAERALVQRLAKVLKP